ncbi:MAG: hypothetical protein QGI88_06440, partial [SAR202 cluster bacterium]|nr:hypothetical protein [SAR202 cluster bacterium]
ALDFQPTGPHSIGACQATVLPLLRVTYVASCFVIVVLPMPGSPTTITNPPFPERVDSKAAWSCSTSGSLPMKVWR